MDGVDREVVDTLTMEPCTLKAFVPMSDLHSKLCRSSARLFSFITAKNTLARRSKASWF
jgi:hypothetical protein